MPLSSGARLGPYEIQAAIGAGGMGEVYKARDTRLDRTVAIKILPPEFSADPDRRARFEREAKTIAGLNHPHICTLHDVGEHDGSTFLVMEHLAGQTLAERLTRGSLPLAQALDIATQIADALDAAHKHGIIHRDLKPGNVILTSGGAGRSGVVSAKLLDFGLAKLAAHGERQALTSEASAPTQTLPVTARGAIVGTLPYMAPEQLEGKEADARTDLWALGALLYEMVTGKRAFEADSDVSLVGRILNTDPAPVSSVQPLAPPALDLIVRQCLAKSPDDRPDTAHDVANNLRWTRETSRASALSGLQPRQRRGRQAVLVAASIVAGMMIGAALVWTLRPVPSLVSLSHPSLNVSPADELNSTGPLQSTFLPTPGGSRTALAWTPDGRGIVFVGRHDGVQRLYLRRLDRAEAQPIENTEGAQVPAVSADGRWVAFWSSGAIRKVPLGGGPVMDLVPRFQDPPWGLAWDLKGRLFIGRGVDEAIWMVPADGTPAPVTAVANSEMAHILPSPMPDGETLLYTVRKRQWSWGDEEVVAHTLATGARKVLLKDAVDARYVSSGHLVFLRRGALFAVPFDAGRLEVRGNPTAVLNAVAQALTAGDSDYVTGAGQFAVAPNGSLAWLPGPVVPYPDAALVVVDRRGQVSPIQAPVRSYGTAARISPDGRRLAVMIRSLSDVGVWLYDVSRGTTSVLAGGGEAWIPIWSPDGRRLAFAWLTAGRHAAAVQRSDGTSPPQALMDGDITVSSFTPDGRQIAAVRESRDIVLVGVEPGTSDVRPLTQDTQHIERWPEFSPDGRWLAYGSNVSGRFEVYVRPYPSPGPAELVSVDGGWSPAWNPSGRELFFVSLPNQEGRRRLMVVDFAPGSPPGIGRPRELFAFDPRELRFACAPVRCFDVASDGQKFYATRTETPPPPPVVTHINLILNWAEDLEAKVPRTR